MPPVSSRAEVDRRVDAAIASVAAIDEQTWNDAALDDGPVVAPRLRLWRYREPAVVLGRSQQALGRLVSALQPTAPQPTAPRSSVPQPSAPWSSAPGPSALPVVERRAGGGAVLVGPWLLGMSLVVPPDHPWVANQGTGASYRPLGRIFTDLLVARGVAAAPATGTRKPPPGLEWACFAGVTAHEVLVGHRKIVGLAQRRHRNGVLFVAGVLVDPAPWADLAATMLPLLAAQRGLAGISPGGNGNASTNASPGANASTGVTTAGHDVAAAPREIETAVAGLAAETISIAEASRAPGPADIDAIAADCLDRVVTALARLASDRDDRAR